MTNDLDTNAADDRASGKRDKQWLDAIGWPERFPGPKLDPSHIPAYLHPIIPFAERWVNEDDIIQATVIQVASNEALEEFLRAVNEVGIDKITASALEMGSSETQYEASNILLAMLDAVEAAEYELRRRSNSVSGDKFG